MANTTTRTATSKTPDAPVVLLLVGALLLGVFFSPALIGFLGPFGHCYQDAACEAKEVILTNVVLPQAKWGPFGNPVATLTLTAIAFRVWQAWVGVVALSAVVVLAGSLPVLTGFWNVEPRLLGVSVPLVSPGFVFWVPPAIAFLAAGLVGVVRASRPARQRRKTGRHDRPQ